LLPDLNFDNIAKMQKLFFTLMCGLMALSLWAQPKLNSPYSRYALGDPGFRYFPSQGAMGGQYAAQQDPFHLNIQNPAGLAYLRTTALETGLYGQFSRYSTASNSNDVWSGNLAYFALGFTLRSPINELLDRDKRKWKYAMALSLTPYSNVGYRVSRTDTLPDVGEVFNDYQGRGGTYRLAWHGAARYKNTSFGGSLGWMFGRTVYETTAIFIDSLPSRANFQDNFSDEFGVGGLVWNLGVQHNFIISTVENDKNSPRKWLTVGLSGNSNHRLNATADVLRIRSRERNNSANPYLDADTLFASLNSKRRIVLPAAFSLGLQFVHLDKFKLGTQFGFESWANYSNEIRPESLRSTINASVGAEWIPDIISYNTYLRRVRYRAGAYFRQDPRVVLNENVNDVGLSLGFGFPLILPRQQTSFINVSLEAGRIGGGTLIAENYARLTLGFTLNDNSWFFKRRFE
jgi:hypothetical protein